MDSFKNGVDNYAADKNDKKDCHDTSSQVLIALSASG